ncbi:MAG: glycosyltransferase [Blastocatellia bacterium]|nr:glycosyltransferase [Blastocatellia bacterium]
MTHSPGNRKIRILHVLDSLAVGGMERVVIDVANLLDPARFEQVVCCLSRRGEAAHLLRPHVRCLDLGKGNRADYLMPKKIMDAIRRERPDIVHSQSWSGVDAAIATRLMRGPRLIHSEHGRNLPHIHAEPWKRRVARRALYHLADAVFAVSAELRDYYCRETGFPRERMRVIPNGVDLRRLVAEDGAAVRRELRLGAEDFVLGTVARLDATKDTMTLVRGFARLHLDRRRPANLKLLVVGDGERRADLERFVVDHELTAAVRFTGVRHDVPRLLAAMDLFALSSLTEGLPITVLEAMGAGLPVLATRVGALPELVAEGETGFLVPPAQAESFAEKIAMLYDAPALARRLGAAGRRMAEREHGIDRMLDRYADLYLRVAEK